MDQAPTTPPSRLRGGQADHGPRPQAYRPWLHAYSMLFVLATFTLLMIGGNVTSIDAGLAVPEGWRTFGYFTLWAPLEVWFHDTGTFWEHSHRLMGYLVGFMSLGLAVWLFFTQKARPWLRWLGVAVPFLVFGQAVMGVLRVNEISTNWAVVHGVFGQMFFALTVLITAASSRMWIQRSDRRLAHGTAGAEGQAGKAECKVRLPRGLRVLTLVLLGAMFVQLALGAWMRHHGDGGPAVPDFPTVYGQVLPPTDQAVLDELYEGWPGAARPAGLSEVWVHMSHRYWAVVVSGLVAAIWSWLIIAAPRQAETRWPGRWIMLLLIGQVALGAYVIWTAGLPWIATAHQFTGAAMLGCAVWLAARVHLANPEQGEAVTPANEPVLSGPREQIA